jgi:hypothetical protein
MYFLLITREFSRCSIVTFCTTGNGGAEDWDVVGPIVELGPLPYPLVPCARPLYDASKVKKGMTVFDALASLDDDLLTIKSLDIPMVN